MLRLERGKGRKALPIATRCEQMQVDQLQAFGRRLKRAFARGAPGPIANPISVAAVRAGLVCCWGTVWRCGGYAAAGSSAIVATKR